jgi:hypothetical protein
METITYTGNWTQDQQIYQGYSFITDSDIDVNNIIKIEWDKCVELVKLIAVQYVSIAVSIGFLLVLQRNFKIKTWARIQIFKLEIWERESKREIFV